MGVAQVVTTPFLASGRATQDGPGVSRAESYRAFSSVSPVRIRMT